MKRTINEIYEIIKLHKDELLNILHENIKDIRDKVFNDIGLNKDIDMNDYYECFNNTGLLKVKIDLYEDILNLIEESGVLEEENNLLNKNSRLGDIILEQDKEIEKLNKEIEYRHKLSTEIAQEEKLKDMALKLACRRIDYLEGNEDSEYVTDPFTFVQLAKEELDKGE